MSRRGFLTLRGAVGPGPSGGTYEGGGGGVLWFSGLDACTEGHWRLLGALVHTHDEPHGMPLPQTIPQAALGG